MITEVRMATMVVGEGGILPPTKEQAETFAHEYVLYARAMRQEPLSETEVQLQIAQYTDKILRHDIADMVRFLEEQKQAKWEQDEEMEMDLDNGAAPDAENSNFADPEHLSTQLASLYRTEYQEISANTEHTMPEQTELSEALLLLLSPKLRGSVSLVPGTLSVPLL